MSSNPYQTPETDLTRGDGSKDALAFKRFSAWGVFGLTIITFGIYPIYWLYTRSNVSNSVHEKQIPAWQMMAMVIFFVAMMVSSFISGFLEASAGAANPGEFTTVAVIELLANLGYLVFFLIVAFTLRNRLQDILSNDNGPALLSGVMTFFFNVIYLQYKINERIDELQV